MQHATQPSSPSQPGFLSISLPLSKTKSEQIRQLQNVKDNAVEVMRILLQQDDVSFIAEPLEFIQHIYDEANHMVKALDGTYKTSKLKSDA